MLQFILKRTHDKNAVYLKDKKSKFRMLFIRFAWVIREFTSDARAQLQRERSKSHALTRACSYYSIFHDRPAF